MGCRLCSPTAPGRCLHFECRGAPARVRAWRREGRPPLPHHFVCVETFTLPYLMTALQVLQVASAPTGGPHHLYVRIFQGSSTQKGATPH